MCYHNGFTTHENYKIVVHAQYLEATKISGSISVHKFEDIKQVVV